MLLYATQYHQQTLTFINLHFTQCKDFYSLYLYDDVSTADDVVTLDCTSL